MEIDDVLLHFIAQQVFCTDNAGLTRLQIGENVVDTLLAVVNNDLPNGPRCDAAAEVFLCFPDYFPASLAACQHRSTACIRQRVPTSPEMTYLELS